MPVKLFLVRDFFFQKKKKARNIVLTIWRTHIGSPQVFCHNGLAGLFQIIKHECERRCCISLIEQFRYEKQIVRASMLE